MTIVILLNYEVLIFSIRLTMSKKVSLKSAIFAYSNQTQHWKRVGFQCMTAIYEDDNLI